MKIQMLSEQKGSVDGLKVATYEAGKEYDLSGTAGARELAAAFVGARMAVEVAAKAAPEPAESPDPVAPIFGEVVSGVIASTRPGTKPAKGKK